MKCPVFSYLPPSSRLWESGNPAGFAGFPSGVGKSLFDFSTPRLFHSLSRRHFFCCRPRAHVMGDLHQTFPGATAPALACSTGASGDSPAARGDPFWAWAALLSWPWPLRALPPELELGLESPPIHRSIAITNLQAPVFPFAHRDFALGRRILPGLRLHLEIAIVVPNHPVVANDSPAFQMKNFLQLHCPRGRSMIVLGLRRDSSKPPIVFGQICFVPN